MCVACEWPWIAPLSVPETLTCDVSFLSPRVRLLGAVSCATTSFRKSILNVGKTGKETSLSPPSPHSCLLLGTFFSRPLPTFVALISLLTSIIHFEYDVFLNFGTCVSYKKFRLFYCACVLRTVGRYVYASSGDLEIQVWASLGRSRHLETWWRTCLFQTRSRTPLTWMSLFGCSYMVLCLCPVQHSLNTLLSH